MHATQPAHLKSDQALHILAFQCCRAGSTQTRACACDICHLPRARVPPGVRTASAFPRCRASALVLGSRACQKRRSVLLATISLREGGHLNNNRLASIKLRHLLDIWQPERGLLKGKQIRVIIMPGNGFWFNNDHVSELSASGNSYHSQM